MNLFDLIQQAEYIIQETIIQHDKLNKTNPYCIDTFRANTYVHDDGTVEILLGIMRFGRKGSVVDISSSGSFFISIDLNPGKLGEYGVQLLRFGNKTFINILIQK